MLKWWLSLTITRALTFHHDPFATKWTHILHIISSRLSIFLVLIVWIWWAYHPKSLYPFADYLKHTRTALWFVNSLELTCLCAKYFCFMNNSCACWKSMRLQVKSVLLLLQNDTEIAVKKTEKRQKRKKNNN